jgi:hypothetical protein
VCAEFKQDRRHHHSSTSLIQLCTWELQNESWLKKVCIVLRASPHSCSSHVPAGRRNRGPPQHTPNIPNNASNGPNNSPKHQPTQPHRQCRRRQQVLLRTYRSRGNQRAAPRLSCYHASTPLLQTCYNTAHLAHYPTARRLSMPAAVAAVIAGTFRSVREGGNICDVMEHSVLCAFKEKTTVESRSTEKVESAIERTSCGVSRLWSRETAASTLRCACMCMHGGRLGSSQVRTPQLP